MKKATTLAAVAALFVTGLLAGCGNKGSSSTTTGITATVPTAGTLTVPATTLTGTVTTPAGTFTGTVTTPATTVSGTITTNP